MPGPLSVELNVDVPPEWEDLIDVRLLVAAAEAALGAEGLTGPVEVDLSMVREEEIRQLNALHRGIDAPTDVLSFPLMPTGGTADGFVGPPDGIQHLGDIVISLPRAREQAREYGHSAERELAYLFVHGLLHLLGYDHDEEVERLRMRQREEAALAAVGLTR